MDPNAVVRALPSKTAWTIPPVEFRSRLPVQCWRLGERIGDEASALRITAQRQADALHTIATAQASTGTHFKRHGKRAEVATAMVRGTPEVPGHQLLAAALVKNPRDLASTP